MAMYNESSSSRRPTGGSGEFIHPEFVFSGGKKFLSSWGEENLRAKLEVFEDTVEALASGRIDPADAQDFALRALRQAEQSQRPLA